MTLLLDAGENLLPEYFPPCNERAQPSALLRPKTQFPTSRSLAWPNTQEDSFYREMFQLGLEKGVWGDTGELLGCSNRGQGQDVAGLRRRAVGRKRGRMSRKRMST